MKAVLAVALIALCGTAYGQYQNTAHSARSSAMGGCIVPDDTVRRLTVDYRRTYMLAEMSDKGVEAVWPTGRIGIAGASYATALSDLIAFISLLPYMRENSRIFRSAGAGLVVLGRPL